MPFQPFVSKARSLGLNVEALFTTPSDGNCFYHALIETLSLSNKPYPGNFRDLRQEIVTFVEANRDAAFVRSWITVARFEGLISESVDLDFLIRQQYRNSVYADKLFISAAARKLNIVILVTRNDSTPRYPFAIFWPMDVREDADDVNLLLSYSGTKVLIGHAHLHFQSLKFVNENCLIFDNHTTTNNANNTITFSHKVDKESASSQRFSVNESLIVNDINFPSLKPIFQDNFENKKQKIDTIINGLLNNHKVDFNVSNPKRKRKTQFTAAAKEKPKLNNQEKKLHKMCEKFDVQYIEPKIGESSSESRERRKYMRKKMPKK